MVGVGVGVGVGVDVGVDADPPLTAHGTLTPAGSPTMVQEVGTIAAVPARVAVRPNWAEPPGARLVAHDGPLAVRVPAGEATETADQMLTSVCGKSTRTCHGLRVVPVPFATVTADWKPVVHEFVVVQVTFTRGVAAASAPEVAIAPVQTRPATARAAMRAWRCEVRRPDGRSCPSSRLTAARTR
jgi:hypothetical protein